LDRPQITGRIATNICSSSNERVVTRGGCRFLKDLFATLVYPYEVRTLRPAIASALPGTIHKGGRQGRGAILFQRATSGSLGSHGSRNGLQVRLSREDSTIARQWHVPPIHLRSTIRSK
jgi:hypothetical protein